MKKEEFIIECVGTPILGSVCSFAHDHAIFKMIDFLKKLEKACDFSYNIENIHCGGEGKLPVECCEVTVTFEVSEEEKTENIAELLEQCIEETAYEGICWKQR